jgi:hypothetical protein
MDVLSYHDTRKENIGNMLMIACHRGYFEIVKDFIRSGAYDLKKINIDGNNALMIAGKFDLLFCQFKKKIKKFITFEYPGCPRSRSQPLSGIKLRNLGGV